MHDGEHVLADHLASPALDRLDDDLLRALLRLFLRLLFDLADATVRVLANLVLDLLEKDRLRLGGGHGSDALELLAGLLFRLVQLVPGLIELVFALPETLLAPLDALDPAVELLLLLLEASLLP